MDAEKLRDALVRAQSLAPKLGQAADELNNSFVDLEAAIRATDLRVPVCIELYPELQDGDPTRPIGATYLSWEKLKGKWCLTISTEWYSAPFHDSKHVTAASLLDRKRAAGKAHELVAGIADAIERQVQEVTDACKRVDAVTAVVIGDDE